MKLWQLLNRKRQYSLSALAIVIERWEDCAFTKEEAIESFLYHHTYSLPPSFSFMPCKRGSLGKQMRVFRILLDTASFARYRRDTESNFFKVWFSESLIFKNFDWHLSLHQNLRCQVMFQYSRMNTSVNQKLLICSSKSRNPFLSNNFTEN